MLAERDGKERSELFLTTSFGVFKVGVRFQPPAGGRSCTSNLPRPTAHGPRPTAHGPRPTAHGPRPTAHGPRPTAWFDLAVRAAVALTLLVAVWFKATSHTTVGPLTWLALPSAWLLVVAVVYELLLAAWLISGVRPAGATVTAIVTFAGFAALSAQAGWLGRASCGCLGEVRVSPWLAALFDLGVVCALAAILGGHGRLRGAAGGVVRFAGCVLGAAVLWTTAAGLTFNSSDALLAYLRSYRVVPLTSVLDLGSVPAGEPVSGAVVLRNTTSSTVTVIGGSSDCACTLLADLPLTLPAGGEGRITIWVTPPADRGEFTHHVAVWTDAAEGRRTIPVAVVGRSTGL